MGNFIVWIAAELGEYALFSFLARFSRAQWMVFLTALVLLITLVFGELTWKFTVVILSGAVGLWGLLVLLDLGLDKIMRHH